MSYAAHIVILVAVYATLAVSLNLLSGFAGILSVAQAAFFAIGAYAAALITLHYQANIVLTVVTTAAITLAFAIMVGIPGLKSRNGDFVITSFAIQVFVFGLLNNWITATGGPIGLSGIKSPHLFGIRLSGAIPYAFWAVLLLFGTLLFSHAIRTSAFGRVLLALREDSICAESHGKKTTIASISMFASGAVFAALAGNLYAHYMTYISPGSFTVMESIFILTLVIIGGAGSLWGPVLGAIILVGLPEVLRFLQLPQSSGAAIRQLLYGFALVACMLWRPQGLIGEYAFGREPKSK